MSKIIVFACMIAVIACSAWAYETDIQALLEQNSLAKILLKSSRSLNDHPERSSNCFLIYLPQLNAATEKYEREYNSCLEKTYNATQRIEAEVAPDRKNVETFGNGICDEYAKCSVIKSSVDYFECYNKAAGESINISYNIQTVSGERSKYIAFRLQMIQYDQNTCTEKCKNEYVEESAQLYAALDLCLANGEYVPPAVETTTVS